MVSDATQMVQVTGTAEAGLNQYQALKGQMLTTQQVGLSQFLPCNDLLAENDSMKWS